MDQKLSALIIDDEESARKLLARLLEETQFFCDIKTAQSVNSAYTVLSHFTPDMIFLDIQMPGRDGLSFIQDMPNRDRKTGIVFVTAFEQYAIKAIKNQAFDYLLKPVNRKELKQCILKFIELRQEDQTPDKNDSSLEPFEKFPRIRINSRNGTNFVNPASILYCKADGNYTNICTGEKQYLCSMNLGKVEEQLPKVGFIRVGRSLIINYEYIIMLDRKESELTLFREGETVTIPIPRRHIKDVDRT